MIQFEKALEIVLNNAVYTGEEQVGPESAAGRVLSRDVFSDMDMPLSTNQLWTVLPAAWRISARGGTKDH